MNPFLYSMRLLGLKHGSEEEYDMFEDFAICRARNGRTNGASDSRLQFEPTPGAAPGGPHHDGSTAELVTQQTRRDGTEHLVQEEYSCAAGDGKHHGQEKDIIKLPSTTLPNMTPPPPPQDEPHGSNNAPGGHFDDLVCTEAADSIHPDPSSSSDSAVLQITIQVKCVQTNMKCGESPAVCNDPLQAGADEF